MNRPLESPGRKDPQANLAGRVRGPLPRRRGAAGRGATGGGEPVCRARTDDGGVRVVRPDGVPRLRVSEATLPRGRSRRADGVGHLGRSAGERQGGWMCTWLVA